MGVPLLAKRCFNCATIAFAIKAGAMEYEALLQMADDLIASIESLYETSTLPETPNVEKTVGILVELGRSCMASFLNSFLILASF